MSAASRAIDFLLRLSGVRKGVTAKKFYRRLRKNAIRNVRWERCSLFFGVKVEKGVYCGMRYYRFIPRETDTLKSVLYVHGSGYVNAPHFLQFRFAAQVARNTHANVYFPLYPKLPISTALPCFALLNNFYAFLRKKGKVFPVGDSSGAALCLALAAERGEIDFVIAISPWLSLSVSEEGRRSRGDLILSADALDRAAELWAYDLSYDDVKVSPINGSYRGKRIWLFAGEEEIFRADILRFLREQVALGATVRYEEGRAQQHCYPLFPTPEGRAAKATIYRALQHAIYEEGE